MLRLRLASIFVIFSIGASAAPIVTDVVAKQRYPWKGLVDITCEVSGVDEVAGDLKFDMAAVMPDSGNIRKVSQFWVVNNGMNLTDCNVYSNGGYRLLWDAQTELGAVEYSNMVIRISVVVVHGKVQLWKGGPYWADRNIGAENSEDYGYYFWWGDTIGYKWENNAWVATDGSSSYFSFDCHNTPTYNKSNATMKDEGWITAYSVLVPEHDAAHAHWGGSWRMPTSQELSDLISKCSWSWTTQNGVPGYEVRGKGAYASASIFLPCSGASRDDGTSSSFVGSGSSGYYWSSVSHSDDNERFDACGFLITSYRHSVLNYRRSLGFSVRPVQGLTE